MPKIKITEQDLTTGLLPSQDNVVFVPIKVLEDSEFGPFEPTLVSTLSQLIALCPQENADDEGWIIVKRLIAAGLVVLVQGVTGLEEVDWDALADKSLYDIRFLTAGAFEHADEEGGVVIDDGTNIAMMQAAQRRGDAVALCDHPAALVEAEAIKAYVGTVGLEGSLGSFGAMFTPWANFTEGGSTVTLPGSFSFLLAYANSILTNPTWFAVAGSARGIIPGLVSPLVKFGTFDINLLQGRGEDENDLDTNEGIAINPIAFIRPFGYLIWGNRTLKTNTEGTTALSFLNVRNLVSEIKKTLFRTARTLTFEQNSDVLWSRFTLAVYPTLDRMLSGNGISGYKVIRQATPARARLKATVRIFPIEAVEDFELSVILEDEAATVTE
jgi:hypothetical protein